MYNEIVIAETIVRDLMRINPSTQIITNAENEKELIC